MKRVMALDVGFKRIGVALSDPLRLTVQPYAIIERKSNAQTFEKLLEIITSKNVGEIVIGLPISIDGKKTKIAEKFEKFARKLENFLKDKGIELKFHFADESLSTERAKEIASMLKKKRKFLDNISAAVILEEWLESECLKRSRNAIT